MTHRIFVRSAIVFGLFAALPLMPALAQSPERFIEAGTSGKALPTPSTPPRTLRLAILPDRTTGRDWGLKYLHLAVEDLNRLAPDAVLSIGDMIQGYTRSTAQWKIERDQFYEIIQPLSMPFYPLPGNHEVVSGTRDSTDQTFEDLYKKSFGPLYYAVQFDLATVICLYSDDRRFSREPEGIASAQRDWLKEALARAKARQHPIFILLHRPLWRSRNSGWNEEIHPLLVEAGVDAVIAGHFHSMQRDPDRDGVQYHLVAVCGGMIDQHPLTGQFQQLTFLNVRESGEFAIHHQPVGTTLPDDFILSVDQDRVFRLKTMRRELSIAGVLPDPQRAAVEETFTIELTNPVDVPIRADLRLVDRPPGPTVWNDAMWLSRTQQDIFNPFVTESDTPIELIETFEPVTIEPGETIRTSITVRCEQQRDPVPPAEVWLQLSFVDSYDRTVPVIVRRRIPIAREIELAGTEWSLAFPVCAWVPSVYDTEEANPEVRLAQQNDRLLIEVTVPDRHRSAYDDQRPLAERMRDPMSDAVTLQFIEGALTSSAFAEPFRSDAVWTVEADRGARRSDRVRLERVETLPNGRWRALFAVVNPEAEIRLNVGVADNDETYHTQWRWLAPEEAPLRVRLRMPVGAR